MNSLRRNVDIAIIGLSCRFPGAATAAEYWKNLCNGVESITFFSDQELLAGGVDPALVANPNYVKAAPTLRDVEMFDAEFFGFSPKDAALMDPQQRLFLEVCWEAFESAGYEPAGYPGKVGVLSTAGGVVSSYLLAKLHHPSLPGQTASTSHIATDKDFLSTRVSFKLNLTGPSFTIQSACSSSLLAVHQACQMLRFGECDMMLVGGAVVRVPQIEGYLAEKRNLHSLDGHCRPFDAVGQGTIFGSGVGAALLKPLEQAVADRDHILAVIKGTAANNDGSGKSSYTAPSLDQQSRAVLDALELAGVSADSVGYIECHSTGTIVGDPLEIEALTMAFRNETSRKQYCALGSVKANIGHPEQAAGIAGLIKAALVLHHKQIPPNINYDTPNPSIDFESSPFFVNTKLRDFPLADSPRRAGLNSLGIGGTNAFAVLEEAPPIPVAGNNAADHLPCLVTLSAKSPGALVARVKELLNWLNDSPDASIGDVCYTTNVSRSQFAFRFAVPASSVAELKKHLAAWLRTVAADPSSLRPTRNGPIAFLFSGQGSQHAGMAAKLYRTHSIFRNAMDLCHTLAEPHLEQGLLDVIFAEESDAALVNRTDYTQPALFAVEYAVAELLKSWGITPEAVTGHSLGEFTAAWLAEVITLKDAMRLVTARGALMHRLPGGGGMTAIFANESVVRTLIDKISPEITVAAMNGPQNTVVSGELDALRLLSEELGRQNISYRELHISNAFHSPRTEPILDELESIAGDINYSAPKRLLVSNLTGGLMERAPDKVYWRRHLRETVRFGDGILALSELGCQTFLEIGPHPVLLPLAQTCLGAKGKSATWVPTLNRQKSDAESITEMLVALYLAGHNINWVGVHADSSSRRVPLPTYPFQRKRYWLEDDSVHVTRARNTVERQHPLVGTRIRSTSKETHYEASYGVRHAHYLSDHRVAGTIVLPTTAELEAATVVARRHFGTSRISFDNVMHHQAISFANGEDRTVRVLVSPLNADRASFKLVSADTENSEVWRTHMTGTLRKAEVPSASACSTEEIRARCQQTLPVADFYNRLDKLGLEYGPSFRGIQEVHIGQHEALTRVQLLDGIADTQYVLHPAFLDACLHAYPLVLDGTEKAEGDRRNAYFPVSLERFRCYQDGIDEAWVHSRLRSREKDDTQVIDIRIYDDAHRPVADLDGLAVRLLPLAKVQTPQTGVDDLFYRVAWRQSERAAAPPESDRSPASWLIFADAKGVGVALAGRLEAAGHHCHLVYRDKGFAQRGARTWTANEREPQDFRRLLGQCAAAETLPCEGVVYLWGLDAPSIEGLTLGGLKSASEMMCRGALAVLQALAETRPTGTSGRRLWIVTANTQKPDGQDQHVDPVQAPLWGLGRTAAIEYPAIWGGLIDLQSEGGRTPDIDLLAEELLHPDGEPQIVFSPGNRRSVARLVRQPLAELPAQMPQIRGDATYLVTGGLGMLGRSIAEWLIDKGARHLVLTSRNANPETTKRLIGSREIRGAIIHVVAADISRDEDVSRLMQTIDSELPPLRGVVHSAGILDDGIMAQLDWDRFARVFEPKVYGSWLLHEHTKSLELDFFILQSSLLSLLGSAGQGNYAASNTFVDSLTTHRRAAGLPAMAINWSAWSGGGLATVSGARGEAMWSSLGVKFISPKLAMQAFDKLMQCDAEQIAVAIADWPTYAGKAGQSPLLADLLNGSDDSGTSKPARGTGTAAAHTGNGMARQQLSKRLQQRIMAELGFEELIDPERPLNEVGLDSLRSVTLANNLEDEFGVLVPISELISGPTINQLVDHLSELLPRDAKVEAAEAEPVMPPTAIRPLADSPSIDAAQINSRAQPAVHATQRSFTADVGVAASRLLHTEGLQPTGNGYAPDDTAFISADKRNGPQDSPGVEVNEKVPPISNGGGTGNLGKTVFRPPIEAASGTAGKWLIAPRPNPDAKARLFCFPYAGGGLVSFRALAQQLDGHVEVVAVEAPGRGTRINESAIGDLDKFVAGVLPEMVDWLDRPSAFFGHCLGGLTMFATLRALPEECMRFVRYAFACGIRPPHLLKRRGEFEDNLLYNMMLHREFDVTVPPYAQSDVIIADMIRQFETAAADKMLQIPALWKALLPTIRAEFGMAYNYEYQPVAPFSFPISSFVGDSDPWVSEDDSAGWGDLTRGGFTNHVRKGSHSLMEDDGKYILETINSEFVARLFQ